MNNFSDDQIKEIMKGVHDSIFSRTILIVEKVTQNVIKKIKLECPYESTDSYRLLGELIIDTIKKQQKELGKWSDGCYDDLIENDRKKEVAE